MNIVAKYSFNGGEIEIERKYPDELREIKKIIESVDASKCKSKESHEITMIGRVLYSPRALNDAVKERFNGLRWFSHREKCIYSYGEFLDGYIPPNKPISPFREMDFVKKQCKLGVEVQFGKYAFMVYNVCAKMTIFKNKGVIDAGVEIVPVKHLVDDMSTGVSYFEQIAWDLTQRGVSNIDVPVLILGIDI